MVSGGGQGGLYWTLVSVHLIPYACLYLCMYVCTCAQMSEHSRLHTHSVEKQR